MFDFIFLKSTIKCFLAILLDRLSLDFSEEVWPRDNNLELVSLTVAVVLKLEHTLSSPGGLVVTQIAGVHPISDSVGLGYCPRICISIMFPSDADAASGDHNFFFLSSSVDMFIDYFFREKRWGQGRKKEKGKH